MVTSWDTCESSVRVAAILRYAATSVVSSGAAPSSWLYDDYTVPSYRPALGWYLPVQNQYVSPIDLGCSRLTYVSGQHADHRAGTPAVEPTYCCGYRVKPQHPASPRWHDWSVSTDGSRLLVTLNDREGVRLLLAA